jgi:DNA-binding MarR family transcriptional regulator
VDAVAERLHTAAVHLSRRLRVEDEARGISGPRLSALSVLVSEGPIRIGRLAQIEQVEPPTMTRLVDAMERDGLVRRRPDPKDRRAVVLGVTAKGKGVLNAHRAQRVAMLAAGVRSLSPAQVATLARGVEILERMVGRARP